MQQSKKVLGLMSGTSLDGVDAALCAFTKTDTGWNYDLLHAETIPYSEKWKKTLSDAFEMRGSDLAKLDVDYGRYLGNICKNVFDKTGIKAELISSHGHTVFHDPDNRYTLQIGNGANIAFESGTPVVCNFRVNDIAAGGQGAPLVPAGDLHLFNQYQACLNLGGFANISFDYQGKRTAFDICPVNIILNHLANCLGMDYDVDGLIGRKGNIFTPLLTRLNELSFYRQDIPKSLGREWFEKEFLSLVNKTEITLNDKFRTVYQHIIDQLVYVFGKYNLTTIMISGGAANNKLIVELLQQESNVDIILPDREIIDYKEAVIFGFLGLLRWMNEINCYSSVTGAVKDTSCGIIYLP